MTFPFPSTEITLCRFLGVVDKLGAAFEEDFMSTAYGVYFCLPLMRSLYHPDMTEDEARSMLEECVRVGYPMFWTLSGLFLLFVNKMTIHPDAQHRSLHSCSVFSMSNND